ncbi:Flagellar assembly protein FliH [Tepidimonas alkaliphilus]|uniref:Flagellar assembly protein FliH n=1 Tax=Tepidimonas alkaliphilus TaxID=2588942 RepID=A0A554W4U5_9BURK|nr:FliH/SctL family protein [Tepidimonas alkaliphilus]TSE18597.1 Flagellar assembly protein FliH [Tepidimonas alkaliphilus]
MPSSNRASHPYQRFIPREEVQAVQAWTFAPVDEATLAAQRAEAEARERALRAATQQQLDEARARGYTEGFEQGRQAGAQEMREKLEAPLRAQAEEQARRLAALLTDVEAELDDLRARVADELLALACDLARQVVRRELAQPLEPLRAVVAEALGELGEEAQPATLRLHPDDLAVLQPKLEELLAGRRVQALADARVSPGGCVLDSPLGVVDATIERRWARALAALGRSEPWQPQAAATRETADG